MGSQSSAASKMSSMVTLFFLFPLGTLKSTNKDRTLSLSMSLAIAAAAAVVEVCSCVLYSKESLVKLKRNEFCQEQNLSAACDKVHGNNKLSKCLRAL